MQDIDQPPTNLLRQRGADSHSPRATGPAAPRAEAGSCRQADAPVPRPGGRQRDELALLGIHPMRIDDVHAVIWESEPARIHHTFVNRHVERLLGYPANTWLTQPHFWSMHVHPEDREHTVAALRAAIAETGRHQHTYRMLHADGSVRWVTEFVREVDGPEGTGTRRLRGTLVDVTDLKQEQQMLRHDSRRYRSLFDASPGIYIVLDEAATIVMINQRGVDELGYEAGELDHVPLRSLLAPGSPPLPADLTRAQGDAHAIELLRRDGRTLVTDLQILPSPADVAGRTLVFCQPASRQHSAPGPQPPLADHRPPQVPPAAVASDPLCPITHVLGRSEIERRLQRLLYQDFEAGGHHVLAVLDVDHFRVVNYRFGQAAGDEVLRELAELLSDCLRPADVIGRIGGDEFALLFEHCSLARARQLCESAVRTIEAHGFEWAGTSIRLSASVGIVRVDGAAQGVSELFSLADDARRSACTHRRGGIRVVDPATDGHDEGDEHLAWAAELEAALDADRLELFYQPIRNLCEARTNDIRHYEVLLRLRREDDRLIGPQRLLLAAERHQLVADLDRWVLSSALRWLTRRPPRTLENELCCINLSAQSLCDQRFVDFALARLAGRDRLTRAICFEVTETALLAHARAAVDGMKALRAVGCRFALDDFGSGAASFACLKRLPVDYLKIDGSFVQGAGRDPREAQLLALLHRIAHEAGKTTIAEYVDSPQTLARVHEIGIPYAQGYEIGRPQPLETFDGPAPRRSAVITPFPATPDR